MRKRSWPMVAGPLEGYALGYRKELARLGYSGSRAADHVRVMADLSRWLGESGLEPAEFSSARLDRFLADRRACGRVFALTARGVGPLLGYLRRLGVVPEATVPEPDGPVARLLEEFVAYLVDERGLAWETIVGYRRVARVFLTRCGPDLTSPGVERLGAAEINAFVLGECAQRSIGSAGNVVKALRALLGFLYFHGYTAVSLADCVPKAASWRETGRSRALEPDQVRRLLASCDRRSAAGRRDFAILTVLARLGLRAKEVASLSLDDLDWRVGEMTVTGKGGRRDRLPVPVDVGQAVADYCRRGRPRNGHRDLFLQVRAPYGAVTSGVVTAVVRRACRRAGIAPVGAHRLRHTSASAMRRAGAPLFEIGQVLRHRSVMSTALYAKEDLDALASIARPWPRTRS